jgi:hypothetical protein
VGLDHRLLPIAATAQSFLYLAMALAATVLLGAFEAYETESGVDNPDDG